jgi:hypothetical protein
MYMHTQMRQAAGPSLGLLSSTAALAGLAVWLGAGGFCGPIHRRLTLQQQCISCMQILASRCDVQASNRVRGTVVVPPSPMMNTLWVRVCVNALLERACA